MTGSTPTLTTSSREVKENGLGRTSLSPKAFVCFLVSSSVWKIASVLVKMYCPVETVRQVDRQTRLAIP